MTQTKDQARLEKLEDRVLKLELHMAKYEGGRATLITTAIIIGSIVATAMHFIK